MDSPPTFTVSFRTFPCDKRNPREMHCPWFFTAFTTPWRESAMQRRGKPRTMSPRMNMASTFSVPALVLLKFYEGVLSQIIEVGVLLRLFLRLLQLLWLSMRLLCMSKCRVLPLHSLVCFSVIFTLFLFSVSVSLSHSSVSRSVSPNQTPSCASSTALSAARHTLRFL